MGHIVKATLIVAKIDSTERYFEKGAILPTGVSTEERRRLVSIGLVEPVKAESDAAAEVAAKAESDAAAKERAAAEAAAAKTAAAKAPGR